MPARAGGGFFLPEASHAPDCALARGLVGLPLIEGTRIGTLAELAESTLWADKVITF